MSGTAEIRSRLTARQWRRRNQTRQAFLLLIVVGVGSALWAADRAGVFGTRQEGDWSRYHDKVFTAVNVVDGDTLDIDCPDGPRHRTRIRLWGVDTPECVHPRKPVQHFGPEASKYTLRAVHGRKVRVELLAHQTRDSFGRLLAYVYLEDGTMLNRQLIRRGLGFADPRFKHRHFHTFRQDMLDAREGKTGLWEKPVPDHLPHYLDENMLSPN